MNLPIAHSGAWGMTAIMIVVASWVLYPYLAPKTWREWVSACIVQAFIIGLYAEIYGFPLTIYRLVRVFGLDLTNLNANLWSSLSGLGDTGMIVAMLVGYALLLVGIGLFDQGRRQGYRARQENRMVTAGLYGLVRHPQYVGLFVALFGEGVMHWPTVFSVSLFPVIVLAYARLSRREERRMAEQFGDAYRAYRDRVPMFVPRFAQWQYLVEQAHLSAGGRTAS